MVGDHVETPLVTISFSKLSVPEAVEAVVGGANHMVLYAAAGSSNERGTISQVWLLGTSGARDASSPNGEEDDAPTGNLDHAEIKRLNDAVLRPTLQPDAGTKIERAKVLSGLARAPDPLHQYWYLD